MRLFYRILIFTFIFVFISGLVLKLFFFDIIIVSKIENYGLKNLKHFVIVQKNNEPEILDLILYENPDSDNFVISRLVAKSGDIVALKNSNLYVNNKLIDDSEFCLKRYRINCFTETANKKLIDEYRLYDSVEILGVYYIDLIKSDYEKLKNDSLFFITQVCISSEFRNNEVFPQSFKYCWNEDNFGELEIPEKNLKLKVNSNFYSLYKNTILYFENKQVTKKDEKIYIEDKQYEDYLFENNYIFVLNDKRSNYNDSRKYGPISVNRIKGIVIATF